MINNNILAEKSKAFGVRIVNCRKYLTTKKHEYMMSDQIYRSGTRPSSPPATMFSFIFYILYFIFYI